MGRPSQREQRRAEILEAFRHALADHGYAGATVAVVAEHANVAPGLLHHHFESKREMLSALLRAEISRFNTRVREYPESDDPLLAYVDAALKLDSRADHVGARCWVSMFAETLREPALFRQMRRFIDGQTAAIVDRGNGRLTDKEASAVLAYIVGSLVLGAFAPRRASGFAAPGARRLVRALLTP